MTTSGYEGGDSSPHRDCHSLWEGRGGVIEKIGCVKGIPKLGLTVGDFWSWAYSDILNNTDRERFAETFRQIKEFLG